MHIVLLSGGSGKRLWPLSSDVRSKQFLKLLPAPSGEKESMVQRVYRQIHESDLSDNIDSIIVAAGEIQKEILGLQLGHDVDIVTEPARRDTYLAIALASSYLYDNKSVNINDIVVCLPVDSFVDSEYFNRICLMTSELENTGADIMLMGAKPHIASSKYGYIIPGSFDNLHSAPVNSFREKPDPDTAAKLILDGALWNCGIFGFRLKYLLDIIDRDLMPEITPNPYPSSRYLALLEAFSSLSRRSFDYEVVEKANNIRVIPYEGTWKDLGTWETFTEEMVNQDTNNVTISSCSNTDILNELKLPIVVAGIDDAVIAANNEGILIASKNLTTELKSMVDHISGRPMYEEKRWGEYTVLEHSISDNEALPLDVITKKLTLLPGKQISYQSHKHRKEVWTITSGSGILYIEGNKKHVSAGDTAVIEAGTKHGIKAETKLDIIEVQLGKPLIEEDITRFEMDW